MRHRLRPMIMMPSQQSRLPTKNTETEDRPSHSKINRTLPTVSSWLDEVFTSHTSGAGAVLERTQGRDVHM